MKNQMVKEHLYILMEQNILEIGKMVKVMVTESKRGKMETSM